MRNILKVTVLALAFLSLGACGDKDNAPTPKPLAKNIAADLKVEPIWKNSVGNGAFVANLRYQLAQNKQNIYVSAYNGSVSLLNSQTGSVIWKKTYKTTFSSGASIGEDALYIGTSDGKVYALALKDGSTLWQAQTAGSIQSKIAVSGDKVVVYSHNGDLSAFSKQAGQLIWQVPHVNNDFLLEGDSSPVIANDQVVMAYHNGDVSSFDLDTGKFLWTRPIAIVSGDNQVAQMVDIIADPVVRDGIVYLVAYHGNAVAMQLRDGQLVWQKPLSSFRNMALSDKALFVVNDKSVLVALDKNTGSVLWQQKDLLNRRLSAPVLLSSSVVVADYAGFIHFLALDDGHILARAQLGSLPLLLSSNQDHMLYAYSQSASLAALKVQ